MNGLEFRIFAQNCLNISFIHNMFHEISVSIGLFPYRLQSSKIPCLPVLLKSNIKLERF